MGFKKVKYQEYPNFTVYDLYKTYDDEEKEDKFLYRTTLDNIKTIYEKKTKNLIKTIDN